MRPVVRPTADALDPWRVAPQGGPEYASDSTAGGIEAGLSSAVVLPRTHVLTPKRRVPMPALGGPGTFV